MKIRGRQQIVSDGIRSVVAFVAVICVVPAIGFCIDLPDDVLRRKFELPGSGNEVWIYLPADYQGKEFPCVLIAPAGTRLFHGKSLGDSDWMEHTSYVQAGFAVIAYELSGDLKDDASDAETSAAMRRFVAAKGGVADAAAALNFAAARIPSIDTDRLYVAGHSSAATTALAIAQASKKVKGVAIYAPPLDLRDLLGGMLPELNQLHEGFGEFLSTFSPSENASRIEAPIMLFYAEDDQLMEESAIKEYWQKLDQSNTDALVIRSELGGHYLSMIRHGMPLGIEWFQRIESGESLDGLPLPADLEIPDFVSSARSPVEFTGNSVKAQLEEGFELRRDESGSGEAFTVQWSDGAGGRIAFRHMGPAAGRSLMEFADELIAKEELRKGLDTTISPNMGRVVPCGFTRGVFRGISLIVVTAASQGDRRTEHFFLSDGSDYWYAKAEGDKKSGEIVRGVVQSFRSVSMEGENWERIYAAGFDPPLHRVGNPPHLGGKFSPTKIVEGDPTVRGSLGTMRGPLLELEVTERTPVANPLARSAIRYDQVEFAISQENDAYRVYCDLYFETPEEGRDRKNLVVYFDMSGAESVVFDESGYVRTTRMGGDLADWLSYSDNQVMKLEVLLNRRERWVEIRLDDQILHSRSFDTGDMLPRKVRMSYGGSTERSARVAVDNVIIEVCDIGRSSVD
ncbi:MAG: dienelactone hydrolase family protein [Verrucomicrobiota bacterium]